MCQCLRTVSCPGCHHGVDRRRFLQGCGSAIAAAGSLGALPLGAASPERKVRVATVFLMGMNTREIWPYPGFNTKGRQQEILSLLREGCPEIEFVPVSVEDVADVQKAAAMSDDVDGYLVYVMTLVWPQTKAIAVLGNLAKPMLVADEFLGGSGVFLIGCSALASQNVPAVSVSTTRLSDLVLVTRQFAGVRQAGMTPAAFARQCEQAYRATFSARGTTPCREDRVALTGIGQCVERFRRSRFLIVGRGKAGEEQDFLGAKGRYLDFEELQSFYEKVDRDEAATWAAQWSKQGTALPAGDYVEPRQPTAEAMHNAAALYLAMLKLLAKYGTDTVTMNCLGGFAMGKLPAYPCLGFMQLLDDGGHGVCEAAPDDTISVLIARILTGRPGFVSDPAVDTSKNQIVYAHCVGTTKVFGPQGTGNAYRIRTLHNRDPRGACAESLMPAGYMTTSFRTNFRRKQMIVHQAKALGPLETERGCRTKLIGEVSGDVGKLFDQWNQFGWHRVTVYGDVREPLSALGKALGLEVIEEA